MVQRRVLRAAAVVAVAVALVACGSDSKSSTSSSSGATSSAAAGLPESVVKAGKLVVGSDIAYPPVESYKEGTQDAVGIDIDICNALAKQMGLAGGCEFQNQTFDGIIPALTAKRFDIIMSAMSDTKERQGQIDFVDYFTVGTSIIVKKGNPEGIKSLDDLCGKTVGLQKGTTQEDVAKAQAEKCSSSGKGELKIDAYETDTDAQQALRAGRSSADMNDFPVAAYAAKTAGDLEVVGEQIEAGPYGIGVRKDDTGLRDALQKALQALIDNGEYAKILGTYDVTKGAVDKATINGGS